MRFFYECRCEIYSRCDFLGEKKVRCDAILITMRLPSLIQKDTGDQSLCPSTHVFLYICLNNRFQSLILGLLQIGVLR